MRQVLSITLLQFRLALKSKGTVAMVFGMPLLLTLIFGLLIGGGSDGSGGQTFPLAVVDSDASFASQKLVEALREEKTIGLRVARNEEVTRLFADKVIAAAVIIPSGFEDDLSAGASPEVKLVAPPGGNLQLAVWPVISREAARVAEDYRLARRIAADPASAAALQAAYDRVTRERQALGISTSHERVQRAKAKPDQRLSNLGERALGFTVMFVMMLVFSMSGVILQERQRGTWGRLLVTPTARASVLTGYLLSFFVTGLFQFAVLVGASSLLFRISWGPLLPLAVMAAAFILCSAGMGLFVAGIVRTYEQQQVVGVLFVNATSMLGGVYWPLELVSDAMRRIGYLTPQAWAMEGFREVMLRGGAWSGLVRPLIVLLALAAIFMTAGLARVRYE